MKTTKLTRRLRKIDFKQLLSSVLAITLLVAIVSGVIAIFDNPTKTINPSVFSKGALDASGEFKKSETQLYTKDLFECQGLSISQDFESESTYEVFYYRADESFIGSTGRLTGDYEKSEFENAKYARIVLTPILEDGKTKIAFFDIYGYAKEIKISVLKDQTFEPPLVQIFEGIEKLYFSNDEAFQAGSTEYRVGAPFVMKDLDAFENRIVTKIGVPVSLIVDPTKDNIFTVCVVEGNGQKAFKNVKTIKCVIPANTFSGLETVSASEATETLFPSEGGKHYAGHKGYSKVQQWYYFDVNIALKDGQTLAFGASDDTVLYSYYYDDTGADDAGCYCYAFDEVRCDYQSSIRLGFDIWCLE